MDLPVAEHPKQLAEALQLNGEQPANDFNCGIAGRDAGTAGCEDDLQTGVGQPYLELAGDGRRIVTDHGPGGDLMAVLGQQPLDQGPALIGLGRAGVRNGQHGAARRVGLGVVGGAAFMVGGGHDVVSVSPLQGHSRLRAIRYS